MQVIAYSAKLSRAKWDLRKNKSQDSYKILSEEYSQSKGKSDLLVERKGFTQRKRDIHSKVDLEKQNMV